MTWRLYQLDDQIPEDDLNKKLADAEKAVDLQPKGWKLNKKEYAFGKVADNILNDQPDIPAGDDPELAPQEHSNIIDDPASLAIKFMQENMIPFHNLCAYRWWEGEFYRFNGIHYDPLPKERIDSDLFSFIEKQFLKQYIIECSQIPDGEDTSKVRKRKVSNQLIGNVKTGLINHIMISTKSNSEPFWLDKAPYGWLPDDVISAKNSLVHLPSFVDCVTPCTIARTPAYFSTSALPYEFKFKAYKPGYEPPPTWRYFLDSSLAGDQESIDCLQEIFGYLLTASTRLQKIFMFVGPKRSGKGTIIRVLKHMIGHENVCFPTFKSFTGEFGSQPLIGKSLAIFPDARITGRTDVGDVVEKMLAISGEDSQTISRKHMGSLTTKLGVRFIVSSNELPRLTENSGALVSRAIIIKFENTFFGEEDIELEDKLIPEIPGILRWSIDGRKRLSDRKRFLQPASGAQLLDEFLHISSPISHFLSDTIDIGDDYSSDTRSLYLSWQRWCEFMGRREPGDMSNFIRNLRSAAPRIRLMESVTHNGDGVAWSRSVKGIQIKQEIKEPSSNGTAVQNRFWGDTADWVLQ